MARDLRPVYTAATEQAARIALDEFAGKWGETYPAIVRLWERAWANFVPFLAYRPEIRKVMYSTNGIESVHTRIRRSVRVRDYFSPTNRRSEMLVPHDQKPRPHRPRPHTLGRYSQVDLDRVADELNGRPRQTLEWMKPSEAFDQLIAMTT